MTQLPPPAQARAMGVCGGKEQKKEEGGTVERKPQKATKANGGTEANETAAGEYKLLLLGAGDSGKSTIFKQIKILHQMGFDNDETQYFKNIIFDNIVESMKLILTAASHYGIMIKNPESCQRAERILDLPINLEGDFTKDIADDIKALWADPDVREAFPRAKDFKISDSAKYFLEDIDRFSNKDTYIPTQEDILRSRVMTSGIIEAAFTSKGIKFRLFDVGGQKSERKKWIQCFAGCAAVIYCVSLSEYDQVLIEEANTNRMLESLQLFEEVVNNRAFTDAAVILFLNKLDLFQEKVKQTNITVAFPDYAGPNDADQCREFIKQKFLSANTNSEKTIFTHYLCATETDSVSKAFALVRDVILQRNRAISEYTL